jgi:DNA-binding CsgD family transcriptional regulator/tetratricopeptide (TPR) repeat protein
MLIGRDAEVGLLESAYRAATDGAGRVVLVSGPAGIGKTILCTTLTRRCAGLGALVLSGGCVPGAGVDIAYAPFISAWRSANQDFGELLAGLAALGDVPAGIGRAWLTDRILGQIHAWSADRPVVLVIEDAQWIDGSGLGALDVVARAAAGHRLLLVVTARDDDEPPARLAELAAAPHGHHLVLGPLTDDAVRVLARAAGGPSVDVEPVVRRSQGHPLFAYELARHDGAAGTAGDRLPPTLRTLLAGRIGALAPLVAAVALAGEWATERLCAAVADRAALSTAVRRGLLVPAGAWIRLRHDLVGEAALAGLLPEQARQLCREVAATLDGAPAAIAAGLWERAGECGRAREAWLAAGEEAAHRRGYDEAARAHLRAFSIAPDPESAIAASRALQWAGGQDRAESVLRSALEGLGPRDARSRCLLLDALRRLLHAAGRVAEADDALAEARRHAEGLAEPDVLAQLAVAEANQYVHNGRYENGAAAGARGAELASAAGLTTVWSYALTIEGACRSMLGTVDEGLMLLERAQELAERNGDTPHLVKIEAYRSFVLCNATRYEQAVRIGRRALHRLADLGLAEALGGKLLYNLVIALVALGRWDEAERYCEPEQSGSAGSGAGTGNPASKDSAESHVRWLLLLRRAEIAALRGESGVDAALTRAVELAGGAAMAVGEADYVRAVAARAAGHYRAAVETCRAALAQAGAIALPCRRLWMAATGLGACADLQRSGGRARRFDDPSAIAKELLVEAEAAAGRWPAAVVPPEPALLLATCRAEAARLEPDGSYQAWSSLPQRWDELGMQYAAAYARARWADALVARRQPGEAAPLLRTAHATALALGADPLRAEIERIARRGRFPLLDSATGSPALSVLTRREREVLELLSWGRTNREISRELFISERTVGVHVSRVLTKLGAGNRGEAARIAHESSTEET